MIVAFSMGCFACCVPCDPCDAVCDETPDEAFAVVYQVEDDRANLTWTGDAMGPIDGPWPGFEGDPGPYTQTITSGSIALPGARFPCYFRLKLWRNVGGGEGSDALDVERVTISCTRGKLNLGFLVLNAGESVDIRTDPENSTATYVIDGTRIALDTNGGDRHAHPPTFWQVSGAALCADTIVTVTASIQWSNDLIQHNLYGQFVECYDEIPECTHQCDGTTTSLPSEIYLTISNFSATATVNEANDVDGTYTLPQLGTEANALRLCLRYEDSDLPGPIQFAGAGGSLFLNIVLSVTANNNPYNRPASGGNYVFIDLGFLTDEEWAEFLACGTGNPLTGSVSGWTAAVYGSGQPFSQPDMVFTISFDWELST